jgi:signal transduction histidine kinase
LTSIIEKRVSLHRELEEQREENKTLQSQLSRLQALANIGTATCMIAHEINNLLTPLASYATLAQNNPDDKSLTSKALQKTVKNCKQASLVMESILAVANGETKEKKNIKLRMLIDEIFNCLCRDFSKDGITVEIKVPEELTVWAIPIHIQQVLMNLILNAREAIMPGRGSIGIEAEETVDSVQIRISDNGCGIAAENLEKIFELFFTTKSNSNDSSELCGSGLGLAFCKKVIDEHGGSILVESEVGVKTTFKINLPKPR